MSDSVLDNFIDKKKAESDFIKLGDGESIKVKRLMEIKMVSTLDFNKNPKDVLRFICLVDTQLGERVKNFDNGTQKFAAEIQKKGVKLGSGFTITRHGLQQQTVYFVSDVTNPPANDTAAQFGGKPAPENEPFPDQPTK